MAIADLLNVFGQKDLNKNDDKVGSIMVIREQLANLLILTAPDVYGHVVAKDKK